MGELALTKYQVGKQSSFGTAVAATRKFYGTVVVPKDRTTSFPDDQSGSRGKARRGVVYQVHVDGIKMVAASFQDVLPLLKASFKDATGSEVTASQGDYLYNFSPSLTAANSPKALTLEYGDDVQAYEIEDVLGTELRFVGKIGQNAGATVEMTAFGKQISTSTFTSLSESSLEDMVANMAKIYVDSSWAGLGGTQKTDILREWDVRILTGLHPKFHGNSKMHTTYAEGHVEVMASFVFEGNANADTEWDNWRAGTARAIRLELPGSVIGSGTPHKLAIDMHGQWEEIVPLAQTQNGNNLHAAILHGYMDSSGNMLAVNLTTNVTSF